MAASRRATGEPGADESSRLLGSAKQFLVEALDNHSAGKNAFAIMHGVTAAELVIKARLARVHPILIRKNIDARNIGEERTAALADIPQRLENLGLGIGADGTRLIRLFASWRNEIVHHFASFDERAVRAQVPTLLNFIAEYLDRELDAPLRSFLPLRLYKTANKELEKWRVIVAAAAARAKAEAEPLEEACPDCGARGVLTVREENQVFCHLCDSTSFMYDRCSQCGRRTLINFSRVPDSEHFCIECIDAAGEAWLSMQEDIRRGK